ncbi:MAG: DUF3047 domain-containing protein [Betaproteobacteria bacterium]
MSARMVLPGLLGMATLAAAAAPPVFSSLAPGQSLPKEFRLIMLPKIAHNKFSLVADDGKTVLRVDSANSAGSVGIPLVATRASGATTLEWRWKVSRILEKADMDHKLGDDYSARVYVFFDVPLDSLPFIERSKIRIARMVAGADVPTAALCYVWDNKHRIGHTAWSPYTTRVRKIVLQSGPARIGQWMSESRDVAADFREAFGIDAPAVTSVAVGNDTDNTDDQVTTWYGDVLFRK